MNKYDIDIEEIIAFIKCSLYDQSENENYKDVVGAFTVMTGEAFLDERALYVRHEIESNDKLKSAFKRLAACCSGRYQKACEDCAVRKYCNAYILGRRRKSKPKLKLVDLFCGAGGLSLGFVQQGFYPLLANDIEPCCIDTYAHNHPEMPRDKIVLGDISKVEDKLEQLIGGENVDVVVGGPPCQGFSMANRQRIINDPRNKLYKFFVDAVNRIRPKYFVMENVKGMQGVSQQVKEDFKAIGYTVECIVFNAKDFGIPQNRERLVFIGNRLGHDNKKVIKKIIKLANESSPRVLKDALIGLRELKASRTKNATEVDSELSGSKIAPNIQKVTNEYIHQINEGRCVPIVCNHKARYNNDRDIEIFGRLNQGDKSDDPKIADIMPYTRRNDIFKDKYFKLEEDKVCKTITAHMKFDCNMYIHPTQARGLTPREAARVQSYPDDYYFRGAYTKTYMQIGNSVPPLMGRVIANVIKTSLKGGRNEL